MAYSLGFMILTVPSTTVLPWQGLKAASGKICLHTMVHINTRLHTEHIKTSKQTDSMSCVHGHAAGKSKQQPWVAPSNPGCTHENITVTPGQTYRFRIINGGSLLYQTVCFEGHNVTVIAADATPTQEVSFGPCIDVNSGQRYNHSLGFIATINDIHCYNQYCACSYSSSYCWSSPRLSFLISVIVMYLRGVVDIDVSM